MLQVTLLVTREIFDTSVAALRLFLKRFKNDVIQIATQTTAQPLRLSFASLADEFRSLGNRDTRRRRVGLDTIDRSAGRLRILFADGTLDFGRCGLVKAIRAMAA